MKCQYCKNDVRLGPDWINHGLSCEEKKLILLDAKVTVNGEPVEGQIEESNEGPLSSFDELIAMSKKELKIIAKENGLEGFSSLGRDDLARKIWQEVDYEILFPGVEVVD